jgi:hypothetical protein|tara:strand:- start:558 stop:1148 length:591 start_codon:yes stop_codon:yes gene_type:complete
MANKNIVINAPNFQTVNLKVTGLTPLIQNKMKETVIQEMADVRAGKKTKVNAARTAIDPKKEFIKSAYGQSNGSFGFPASAFKQCAVRAGKGIGLAMTDARTLFFVLPTAPDGECVQLKSKKPVMRQDPVNVKTGKDLRFRPEFKDWSADLSIRYDADRITIDQIANLLNHGGQTVGVGEWRPEKNGTFGTFQVGA